MPSVESTGATPASRGFAVLIPYPLRARVEGLPPEVRRALLTELFRLASGVHLKHEAPPAMRPFTLEVRVDGCTAHVEVEASRSRLTLVGVR